MAVTRQFSLCVAGAVLPMPCFFPSVSSVKTHLMPVDYVELLTASAHPLFLVSAYDIANSSTEHQSRISDALKTAKGKGAVILMDSGNYEGFWKADVDWNVDRFHVMSRTYGQHLCFCCDNQNPPDTAEAISKDVVASVLRDQDSTSGTVVPIVHGPANLLPAAMHKVAEQLCPVLIAVPERALGDGIAARTRTVGQIRKALDSLGFYCPLHLLGTGNPLSILSYAMAGADSFDGLEWCQTVVDHKTALLYHFQQWDFFRDQTVWGANGTLPYIQSVLLHNLVFYGQFMQNLRRALQNGRQKAFLGTLMSADSADVVLNAIEEGK